MIKLGPTMSITTLNVNGLNTQIKELYCQIGFLKESTIYCVQEIHFKYKSQKLKQYEIKGQRNNIYTKYGKYKNSLSGYINNKNVFFKTRSTTKNKRDVA